MAAGYKEIIDTEERVQNEHWWYINRRKLFADEIAALNLSPSSKILDVGTSCGANLEMLKRMGFQNVEGVDVEPSAIEMCSQKGLTVSLADAGRELPFADDSFDLIIATDILEHIDDDTIAMKDFIRILRPGGLLFVTVPAFQFMLGRYEREAIGHRRRYTKKGLHNLVGNLGVNILSSYYFNFILFLPVFFTRKIIDIFKISTFEHEIPRPIINKILNMVFKLDITIASRFPVPFGVSLLSTMQKR